MHIDLSSTQLVRNPRINTKIRSFLSLLDAEDQQKFIKKFKTEESEQKTHTFRELILGAFLAMNDLKAKYEVSIGGKTPDWLLYTAEGKVLAILDQVTFHQAQNIEIQMNPAMSRDEPWVGWLPDNTDRLYQKIQEKAEKYERLAQEKHASLIIAIFADINASVEEGELCEALFDAHGGGLFSYLEPTQKFNDQLFAAK